MSAHARHKHAGTEKDGEEQFRPRGLFSNNFFSLPLARGCGSVVCLFDDRPATEGGPNDLKNKMGEIFSPFVQGPSGGPWKLFII